MSTRPTRPKAAYSRTAPPPVAASSGVEDFFEPMDVGEEEVRISLVPAPSGGAKTAALTAANLSDWQQFIQEEIAKVGKENADAYLESMEGVELERVEEAYPYDSYDEDDEDDFGDPDDVDMNEEEDAVSIDEDDSDDNQVRFDSGDHPATVNPSPRAGSGDARPRAPLPGSRPATSTAPFEPPARPAKQSSLSHQQQARTVPASRYARPPGPSTRPATSTFASTTASKVTSKRPASTKPTRAPPPMQRPAVAFGRAAAPAPTGTSLHARGGRQSSFPSLDDLAIPEDCAVEVVVEDEDAGSSISEDSFIDFSLKHQRQQQQQQALQARQAQQKQSHQQARPTSRKPAAPDRGMSRPAGRPKGSVVRPHTAYATSTPVWGSRAGSAASTSPKRPYVPPPPRAKRPMSARTRGSPLRPHSPSSSKGPMTTSFLHPDARERPTSSGRSTTAYTRGFGPLGKEKRRAQSAPAKRPALSNGNSLDTTHYARVDRMTAWMLQERQLEREWVMHRGMSVYGPSAGPTFHMVLSPRGKRAPTPNLSTLHGGQGGAAGGGGNAEAPEIRSSFEALQQKQRLLPTPFNCHRGPRVAWAGSAYHR